MEEKPIIYKDNTNNIYHLTLDEYFMKVYGYDVKSLLSLDNETFNKVLCDSYRREKYA